MSAKMNLIACLTAALLVGLALPAHSVGQGDVPPNGRAADDEVDKAFEALKSYDWGQERDLLKAIDDAVVASHKDAAARKALEDRLAGVLAADGSRAAKDFACRKLSLIGTAGSVPALAALLPDEKLSHMARYALERMPAEEAVAAMRDSLPKVKGRVKVGVVNSLGVRHDAQSLAAMVALLKDSDKEIVAAAAAALGSIGNAEAAKALEAFEAPEGLKLAVADAQLTCAERLLADGKKPQATAIYQALAKPDQPKHVQLAAQRGLLAVLQAK